MNKRILILGPRGQYNHLILRRVKELGYEATLLPLENVDRANEFDAVIIGGGPSRLKKGSKEIRLIENLIKKFKGPILGICLGFQAICLALGGELTSTSPSFGPQKVIVKEEDEIFKGIPNVFTAWESHNDTISKIPEELIALAFAEKGYVEAVKHKEKKIYAVLFHPEVDHTEYGSSLLSNFLNIK